MLSAASSSALCLRRLGRFIAAVIGIREGRHKPLFAEPKSRIYHGRFWAERGRAEQGADGTGRPGHNCPSALLVFRASKTTVLNDSPEARKYEIITCRIQNLDISQAGRYGAARGGTADEAKTGSKGRRRDCSPRRKQPLLSPRRWKNELLGVSLEARTKETPFKKRWRNKTSG